MQLGTLLYGQQSDGMVWLDWISRNKQWLVTDTARFWPNMLFLTSLETEVRIISKMALLLITRWKWEKFLTASWMVDGLGVAARSSGLQGVPILPPATFGVGLISNPWFLPTIDASKLCIHWGQQLKTKSTKFLCECIEIPWEILRRGFICVMNQEEMFSSNIVSVFELHCNLLIYFHMINNYLNILY